MFLMKAAVVRPCPRFELFRRWKSTYAVCSYRTISRTVGIGEKLRSTMLPVCCGCTDGALVNVPKLAHSFFTFVTGVHAVAGVSALMAVRWVCVVQSIVAAGGGG